MSDQDVRFTGNTNTMIALTLVASTLSLALSVWTIARIGEVEAYVAVLSVQQGAPAGH